MPGDGHPPARNRFKLLDSFTGVAAHGMLVHACFGMSTLLVMERMHSCNPFSLSLSQEYHAAVYVAA